MPHLDSITGNIAAVDIDVDLIQDPPNNKLSDPSFHRSADIDLLLGVEVFWQLLCVGQIRHNNGVAFQKTKLGWIVTGALNTQSTSQHATTLLSLNNLHHDLQSFWKLDDISSKEPILTPDEKYCK